MHADLFLESVSLHSYQLHCMPTMLRDNTHVILHQKIIIKTRKRFSEKPIVAFT